MGVLLQSESVWSELMEVGFSESVHCSVLIYSQG